jgi:hypothetical protein
VEPVVVGSGPPVETSSEGDWWPESDGLDGGLGVPVSPGVGVDPGSGSSRTRTGLTPRVSLELREASSAARAPDATVSPGGTVISRCTARRAKGLVWVTTAATGICSPAAKVSLVVVISRVTPLPVAVAPVAAKDVPIRTAPAAMAAKAPIAASAPRDKSRFTSMLASVGGLSDGQVGVGPSIPNRGPPGYGRKPHGE